MLHNSRRRASSLWLALSPGEALGLSPKPPGCRLVKDTSAWSNKKESLATERAGAEALAASLAELDEEGLAARAATAATARDQAQAAADACASLASRGCPGVGNGRREIYCSPNTSILDDMAMRTPSMQENTGIVILC